VSFWLVLVGAVFLLLNVARAVTDPVDFARYLGLPLADPADDGFVLVYALRTFFIAALALVLIVRRATGTLALFALLATVMPVGDAVLTARADAAGATVGRHVAIAVYLLVTAYALRRDARTVRAGEPARK
jgi:hypothetical protein